MLYTAEEISKMTPEQFKDAWENGDIHESAYTMLGISFERIEDEDTNETK